MKKLVSFVFTVGLFLLVNSCGDDEIHDASLPLKSGELKNKILVEELKSWFENNPDENTFNLFDFAEEIKWQSAKVFNYNDSSVVEVQIKLKGKYKVLSENDPKINIEHRLLLVKGANSITSYVEYFISKESLDFLLDIEKVNYSKKSENFNGTIVLENSRGEIEVIYQSVSVDDCTELKLKSAQPIVCYNVVEVFNDGTVIFVRLLYCTGGGDSTSSGGGGGTPGNTTQACHCLTECPICHKCLEMLKNAPADPIDGESGTLTTIACEMCACPVPEIDVNDLQNNFPCAFDVYNSFGNFDNFISTTLQSTFGSSPTFNVVFKGAVLDSSVDGDCGFDPNNIDSNPDGTILSANIDIRINDYLLNNSTKEYLAVTYAHETLHALIKYYNANNPQKGKELFPIFYEWPSYEDGDHLTIANRYVSQMADVVRQINPNMPISDANCLAWNGLQGTRTYDLQRSYYDQINGVGAWDRKMAEVNSRERNGTSTIGLKCPN